MNFPPKEKVPDVCRDNFLEFIQSEKNSVKKVKEFTLSRPSSINN